MTKSEDLPDSNALFTAALKRASPGGSPPTSPTGIPAIPTRRRKPRASVAQAMDAGCLGQRARCKRGNTSSPLCPLLNPSSTYWNPLTRESQPKSRKHNCLDPHNHPFAFHLTQRYLNTSSLPFRPKPSTTDRAGRRGQACPADGGEKCACAAPEGGGRFAVWTAYGRRRRRQAMMTDYSEEQRNELEALESIYPDSFTGEPCGARASFRVTLSRHEGGVGGPAGRQPLCACLGYPPWVSTGF